MRQTAEADRTLIIDYNTSTTTIGRLIFEDKY